MLSKPFSIKLNHQLFPLTKQPYFRIKLKPFISQLYTNYNFLPIAEQSKIQETRPKPTQQLTPKNIPLLSNLLKQNPKSQLIPKKITKIKKIKKTIQAEPKQDKEIECIEIDKVEKPQPNMYQENQQPFHLVPAKVDSEDLKRQQLENRNAQLKNAEYIKEQKTNFVRILRIIYQEEFDKQPALQNLPSEPIPNIFSSGREYIRIFEEHVIKQTVAKLRQSFKNFVKSEQYGYPIRVRLTRIQKSTEGFSQFKISDRIDPLSRTISPFKKNTIVILSKNKQFNPSNYSIKDFSDKSFIFIGLLKESQDNFIVQNIVHSHEFTEAFPEKSMEIYLFKLESISTYIKEYLAVRKIQFQEIFDTILNPMDNYSPSRTDKHELTDMLKRLDSVCNGSQSTLIKYISANQRGISLVQGPPGTGKTFTVMCMLAAQYCYLQRRRQLGNKKILVCAPSNTAVDNIVAKLVSEGLLNQSELKPNYKPIVIRIGQHDSITNQASKQVSFEQLCDMEYNKQVAKSNSAFSKTNIEVKQIISNIQKSIRELESSDAPDANKRIADLEYQMSHWNNQLEGMNLINRNKPKLNQIKDRIFDEAHIICCTLSSANNQRLERYSKRISCLIVDEATQATQPNLLIPLEYGINKLILFGDPKQLPATTFANSATYERSLFQRFMNAGLEPYLLKKQYRMQPSISCLSNKLFYNNLIEDAQNVEKRPYPEILKPFENQNVLFLNMHLGQQYRVDDSYCNNGEVQVVKELCNHLLTTGLSVGVISPYRQQVKRMLGNFNHHNNLFISTIDSYQGQEKDIIIISCVRSNHHKLDRAQLGFLADQRRINVAITRSKYLLIIVGNADTLGSNPIWDELLVQMEKRKSYVNIGSNMSAIRRLLTGTLLTEDRRVGRKLYGHIQMVNVQQQAEK